MKRSGPLRRGKPIARGRSRLGPRSTTRRTAYSSKPLLDAVRALPCAFCPLPAPSSAHHFPGKGALAGIDDRLVCPACGDGVRGCHGRAQRYELPAEEQCAAVGRTLAAHVGAGRLDLGDIEEALARVARRDWAELIRAAFLESLVMAGAGPGVPF